MPNDCGLGPIRNDCELWPPWWAARGPLADELNDAIVKVSHHLGVLRHQHLVQSTKSGRFVEYALHPEVFVVASLSDDDPHLDLGCCRLELPAKPDRRRKRA